MVVKNLRILSIPATVPSAGCELPGYLEENCQKVWNGESGGGEKPSLATTAVTKFNVGKTL